MPEGPEIKIAADKIGKAISGKKVESIFFAFDRLKPYEKQLEGKEVVSVKPRGKALLIAFSSGLVVYSHNQLYGKWIIRLRKSPLPKTNRQLRLAIHNDKKSALLYSASDIEVLTPEQLSQHPFLQKLGPDILDEATTEETIATAITATKYQGRQLGHLMLDQGWLCGLGNYLRSEILFLAELSPTLKPKELSAAQIHDLAHFIKAVTWQSYQTKGITNDLDRAARLKADGVRRSQLRHHVFARAGQHCYRCQQVIEKLQWGGRRIYVCRTCQGMSS